MQARLRASGRKAGGEPGDESEVPVEFDSVDAVLDFAIRNEEEAADFYTELAGRMDRPRMKAIFLDFAREERGHKAKLLAIKEGRKLLPAKERILDLKIGDYLVEEAPNAVEDYQGALVVAMKAEKKAFQLYTDLAEATDDEELREILLGLAQEEAKHKLRFEIEYDDHVLREN